MPRVSSFFGIVIAMYQDDHFLAGTQGAVDLSERLRGPVFERVRTAWLPTPSTSGSGLAPGRRLYPRRPDAVGHLRQSASTSAFASPPAFVVIAPTQPELGPLTKG